MLCERYKNALSDVAARGVEPQGELRAHLGVCAACRAAFASEQALFSAIESGLRVAANGEVPTSFLPRVHAHLDEQVSAPYKWTNARLALAGVAALAMIFLLSKTPPRFGAVRTPTENVNNANLASSALPASRGTISLPILQPEKRSFTRPRVASRKNAAPPRPPASHLEPEVLVPRDQELILAAYQRDWTSRKRSPVLAASLNEPAFMPLKIGLIEIAELDVKSMAEEPGQ
jgi:hypothetical protein